MAPEPVVNAIIKNIIHVLSGVMLNCVYTPVMTTTRSAITVVKPYLKNVILIGGDLLSIFFDKTVEAPKEKAANNANSDAEMTFLLTAVGALKPNVII